MKRVVIYCVLLMICCAVTAYVAYAIGYQKSSDLSQWLRYGDVVVSDAALTDLRAGHIDKGTHAIESIYFSHAAMIYGDPRFQQRFAGLTNAAWSNQVRDYLATYYTNRNDWPPVVERLERDLQNWK